MPIMKEVVMNYFSKTTRFKVYDEEIGELPTFTICEFVLTLLWLFSDQVFIGRDWGEKMEHYFSKSISDTNSHFI